MNTNHDLTYSLTYFCLEHFKDVFAMFFFQNSSALLASIIAVDYQAPVDTIQKLLDGDYMLAVPQRTRLPHFFTDSINANMLRCYQECVLDKGGLYEG